MEGFATAWKSGGGRTRSRRPSEARSAAEARGQDRPDLGDRIAWCQASRRGVQAAMVVLCEPPNASEKGRSSNGWKSPDFLV